MRRRIVLLWTATVVFVPLAACKRREPPAPVPIVSRAAVADTNRVTPALISSRVQTTNPPVAAAPPPTVAAKNPAPRQVTLRTKWKPGERYVYRMDLEQNSTNQLPQTPEPRIEHVTMGVTYAVTVQRAGTNGTRDLEVEFVAYELEMKAGGKTLVSFDSGRSATNGPPEPRAEALRKLIGPKIALEVDAEGSQGKVIDLAKWQKRIAGDGQKPAEQILLQQFNEGFFQQITDFGKALPDHPVREGDTWPYRVEVPAGPLGTIQANSEITLHRLEQRDHQTFAVLGSRGTLKGISGPANPNAVSLENGSVSSTTWIDPELGLVMDSVVEQSMRLRAEPPAAPGGTAPGVLTSMISQKVAVMLVEIQKVGQ